jgi:hypothetical protein
MGHRHCDGDYGHQPAELNFWLPFCDVGGNNSLYCETAVGRADFAPFRCRLGQVVQFWGNRLQHFTVDNDTERTRVSLDFRVVRGCDYDANYCSIGKKAGGNTRFALQEYYVLAGQRD